MDKTSHTIPVVELWGQLLVPLQGDIRDSQIDELKRTILERIRDRGPSGMVIDASGVWMMDSHLCATVGKIAAAARLMGVRAVLTGLSSEVVITLQEMGIELEGIDTAIDLEAGLEKLGLRVVGRELSREDREAEQADA